MFLSIFHKKRFVVKNTPWGSAFICCPFHKEDKPSMVVFKDKCHCFGCGVDCSFEELPMDVKKELEKLKLKKRKKYVRR